MLRARLTLLPLAPLVLAFTLSVAPAFADTLPAADPAPAPAAPAPADPAPAPAPALAEPPPAAPAPDPVPAAPVTSAPATTPTPTTAPATAARPGRRDRGERQRPAAGDAATTADDTSAAPSTSTATAPAADASTTAAALTKLLDRLRAKAKSATKSAPPPVWTTPAPSKPDPASIVPVADPAPPPLPPVAPAQPLPPDRIFEGGGIFVAAATDFPVTRSGELVLAHFGWVAVKIHDGAVTDARNDAILRSYWVRNFQQMGLRVCGWGVNADQPVAEARLVDGLIARYGLDCYIADAENAHMSGDYGGDPARSAAFVSEFRRLRPDFPAALSTYAGAPAPWVLPFSYDPWIATGFAFLPQAYLSISTDYDPATSVAYGARVGWPVDKVHPTIGIGWSQGRPALSGAQQIDRLVAAANADAYGYSVFLGETTTRADVLALGKANEEHLLVRAYDLKAPDRRLASSPAAPHAAPAPTAKTRPATKSAALRAAERKVAAACKAAPKRNAPKVAAACVRAKLALVRQKLLEAKKTKQPAPAARRS